MARLLQGNRATITQIKISIHRRVSLNAQQIKPWSRWAAAATKSIVLLQTLMRLSSGCRWQDSIPSWFNQFFCIASPPVSRDTGDGATSSKRYRTGPAQLDCFRWLICFTGALQLSFSLMWRNIHLNPHNIWVTDQDKFDTLRHIQQWERFSCNESSFDSNSSFHHLGPRREEGEEEGKTQKRT